MARLSLYEPLVKIKNKKIITTLMRAVLLPLFLLIGFHTWGQNSKLTVYNPGPRVGEEVEVSITLKKENLEAIEDKFPMSIDRFKKVQDNFYGSGKVKFLDIAKEPGIKQIGPFEFNFDGIKVKTDSILLTIYPALPDSIKEGMWVRVIDFDDKSYLIIEQRIPNNWKPEKGRNLTTLSFSGDDVKFAKLDEAKFKAKGLEIKSSSTSSSSQIVDNNDAMGSATVSFNIATYQFSKTENFKKDFKLDKNMFIDSPEKIEGSETWIK